MVGKRIVRCAYATMIRPIKKSIDTHKSCVKNAFWNTLSTKEGQPCPRIARLAFSISDKGTLLLRDWREFNQKAPCRAELASSFLHLQRNLHSAGLRKDMSW